MKTGGRGVFKVQKPIDAGAEIVGGKDSHEHRGKEPAAHIDGGRSLHQGDRQEKEDRTPEAQELGIGHIGGLLLGGSYFPADLKFQSGEIEHQIDAQKVKGEEGKMEPLTGDA